MIGTKRLLRSPYWLLQPAKSSVSADKWKTSPNPVAALVGLWDREAACPRLWTSSLDVADSAK